jgi:hypothetical protein
MQARAHGLSNGSVRRKMHWRGSYHLGNSLLC